MYRSENQGEIIAIMTRNGIGHWASLMGIRVSPSGLSQLSLPGIAHLVEKSHGPQNWPKTFPSGTGSRFEFEFEGSVGVDLSANNY